MAKSQFTSRYRRFREILIAARQLKGLSQDALAKCLDKPQSFVSKYEHGGRRLDVVEFLAIAEALDIDVASALREIQQAGESK